ncbi:hypothetical protein PsYK624_081280 [Phanerochaete sordida]|uniref:Uncharacterized protein n=1 Tax=Phanerochaete sordida TaxID=48140 RepID=A0A9P3LDY6_9APHY|nr:hypothetical protein PsYK624_081280 [Phanerochaete sordida]
MDRVRGGTSGPPTGVHGFGTRMAKASRSATSRNWPVLRANHLSTATPSLKNIAHRPQPGSFYASSSPQLSARFANPCCIRNWNISSEQYG